MFAQPIKVRCIFAGAHWGISGTQWGSVGVSAQRYNYKVLYKDVKTRWFNK